MAFGGAHFGAGVGPVHLDEVDCNGNESILNNCSHDTHVSCLSGHSKDAGVRCQCRIGQIYSYNGMNVCACVILLIL